MDAFGTDFPTEPSALNTTEGSLVEPNSSVSEQLIEVPPPPTTPLPQPPRDVHHVHHIPPPPAIPPPQPQDLDLKELLSGFGQPSPNASASHSSSSWATPGANSVAAQLFSMPAVLDHQQMLDDLSLLAAMNYPSKTAETTPAYGVLVVLWYTGDLEKKTDERTVIKGILNSFACMDVVARTTEIIRSSTKSMKVAVHSSLWIPECWETSHSLRCGVELGLWLFDMILLRFPWWRGTKTSSVGSFWYTGMDETHGMSRMACSIPSGGITASPRPTTKGHGQGG